jgi:hypothetical protein
MIEDQEDLNCKMQNAKTEQTSWTLACPICKIVLISFRVTYVDLGRNRPAYHNNIIIIL